MKTVLFALYIFNWNGGALVKVQDGLKQQECEELASMTSSPYGIRALCVAYKAPQ